MRVLVAYASKHGATAGIADRVAERIAASGIEAESVEVTKVRNVSDYDAYVVGSAVYMSRWMKEAARFVNSHGDDLADKPLWLFSSGPLGEDLIDDKGRDVFESSRPKDFDELKALSPVDERVFFGAYDPEAPAKGMAEKLMKKMPASARTLPVGDFRDWDAIDAFADEVVDALTREGSTPV